MSLDLVRLRQVLRLTGTTSYTANRNDEGEDLLSDSYRGEFLEGIEFESGLEEELADWISGERARYRSQYLIALCRTLGTPGLPLDHADKIAERLLAEDPADEAAWTYKLKNALADRGAVTPHQVYSDCINAYRGQKGHFPPPQLDELRARLAASRALGGVGAQPAPEVGVTGNRNSERPLLLLTRALNGYGLDPVDISAYEQVIFALSNCRSFDIVEFGAGCRPSYSGASEAYALHAAPRSSMELGFWLSLVNPRQRNEPTSRLSGQLLWTGSVERNGDRSAAIDRQLATIARGIVGEIEATERDRFGPESRATAYRCYLAAQSDVHRVDLASLRRARLRFRDALKLDDTYAPALSGMSRTYLMEWLIRGDPDSNYLHEAWRLARLAVSYDREDARSIHRLAHVELYRKQFDRSLELFDRAISANPNDLAIRADFADALTHAGQPVEAMNVLDEISALDPLVPDNHYWIRGSTEFTLDRYGDAVATFMNLPDPSSAARPMAAALAMSGQLEEAAKYASVVHEDYPSFKVEDWMRMVPNKDLNDHERYAAGLVAAGL